MTKYDISHPSHLVSQMKLYPDAFLSLDPRVGLKQRSEQGERYTVAVKQYQLINPGTFEAGTYFCLSVAEEAVANLEDNNELELVKERRWRLKRA